MVRRVGIVGFGHLGKFLTSEIQADIGYELAFVWNRTKTSLHGNIDTNLILDDLDDFRNKKPDIIVEVAHPIITKNYGKKFLQHCDYMIGSPSALCDNELLKELDDASGEHSLYVPSGAFWGGDDIKKLSDAGALKALKVTMTFHPSSLKLKGELEVKNAHVKDLPVTIYKGAVRGVCALAPNNTNTMAVAALAALNLGFDGVQGHLIADPSLKNYHLVEIEAIGYPTLNGSSLYIHTVRRSPSTEGEVTSTATYAAYLGSLKRANKKEHGIHLC